MCLLTRKSFKMSVVLASESEIKLVALKRFFTRYIGEPKIITLSAPTEFPQPIGLEQTKQCIEQRLTQAETRAIEDTTMLIAIENFVYFENYLDEYVDACLLGVRKYTWPGPGEPTQFSSVQFELCVTVPSILKSILDDVVKEEQATKKVSLCITCGDLLSTFPEFASNEHFSPTDWFIAAGSEIDRCEQIYKTLESWKDLFGIKE